MASNRDPWPRSCAVAAMAVIMGIAALVMLASCQFPKPPNPLQAIYPPGWSPSASQPQSNAIRTVLRANIALPAPNVTLTCGFGTGPMDGVNLWESAPNGVLTLLRAYPATNAFPIFLDQSTPHLIAITSFVNWPPPYLVSSFIDDNGNEVDTTNYYRESAYAYMVYVPQGCHNIGAFTMPDGSIQVVGWSPGNLWLQSSPDQVNWNNVATITNLGAWQVTVDSSQPQMWFRAVQ